MSILTYRYVIDDDENVSITVRPHKDNPNWVIITPTDKKSEEYYGPFALHLPNEVARQLARAITATTEETK